MRPRPVVAIDGPSGAGKSTVAKGVAASLGFAFIDTGAMYRAVAYLGEKAGVSWDDGSSLAAEAGRHDFSFDPEGSLYLDGEVLGTRIRTPQMSLGASAVARHPQVRNALLDIQRKMGESGGVVLEGRDIGTVVFPDAEVKFFLTAAVEVRARRRHDELLQRGEEISLAEVIADQERRDKQDMERETAPLRKADDAMEVDCGPLSAQEVIKLMVDRIKSEFSFD